VTSARDPVATSSQDARLTFEEGDEVKNVVDKTNEALALVRDDIQRLAGIATKAVDVVITSGTYRLPMTASGIAEFWAISDTATTGSTGANYHTISLRRNGAAANTITYRTDRVEMPAYLGGAYLGSSPVGQGDVMAVNIATTGAPTALTTANLSLLCKLREP